MGTTIVDHNNDRGGKCGGDEEMCRERQKYREIETESDSVAQTAQEIETGTVAAKEKESTRKRADPASPASIDMIDTMRRLPA